MNTEKVRGTRAAIYQRGRLTTRKGHASDGQLMLLRGQLRGRSGSGTVVVQAPLSD